MVKSCYGFVYGLLRTWEFGGTAVVEDHYATFHEARIEKIEAILGRQVEVDVDVGKCEFICIDLRELFRDPARVVHDEIEVGQILLDLVLRAGELDSSTSHVDVAVVRHIDGFVFGKPLERIEDVEPARCAHIDNSRRRLVSGQPAPTTYFCDVTVKSIDSLEELVQSVMPLAT